MNVNTALEQHHAIRLQSTMNQKLKIIQALETTVAMLNSGQGKKPNQAELCSSSSPYMYVLLARDDEQ